MPRRRAMLSPGRMLTVVQILLLTIAITGCGEGGPGPDSTGSPANSGVASAGSGDSGAGGSSNSSGGSGRAVDSTNTGSSTNAEGTTGGTTDPSAPPVASTVTTTSPPAADSDLIYGLHALSDAGAAGQQLLAGGGGGGYVVYPFAAKEFKASNFERGWQTGSPVPAGCTLIARLNWSYTPEGTIPAVGQPGDPFSSYADYAALLASLARRIDAQIFIIGNEINLYGEWPMRSGNPVPITVADYVACYEACYAAIKAARPDARVIPSPLAPYNSSDPAHGIPNFLQYWSEMLQAIPQAHVQGLALHAYTHSYNDTKAGLTTNFAADSATATTTDGTTYFDGFRVYENLLALVPAGERELPVYITECCSLAPPASISETSYAWPNRREPWVHNIYAQIKTWNLAADTQKIRCVALFCYEQHFKQQYGQASYDFGLASSPGAVADLTEVLADHTTWR